MRKPEPVKHDENLDYWSGQHFRSWIGPTIPQTAPDYAEKMAHLRRVFQQANLVRECVQNWRDGLLSEPFTWFLKGQDGERTDPETDAVATTAEGDLQRWLDWVAQQAMQADPSSSHFEQADPWNEFVLSLGVLGEGNLRLWQPQSYAEDDDLIHRIHLHAPKTGSVTVDRNDDGFIGKISYTYGTNKKEVQEMDAEGRIVLTDQDSNALTDTEGNALPPIDTGGRWLIQHSRMPSLLTPSIKALQNSINHALTMKLRNNEVAGFREKVFANAEFPEGAERGPGTDLYVYGAPTGDPSNPGYAPVSVFESQPVSTQSLVDSINVDRAMLYREFSQSHLLGDSDAGLSGESRIQQRQAFEVALRGAAGRIESAIANVLNIVLRLLEYEGYEVVVQLNVSTGKLSAAEREEIRKDFAAGLISRPTAMAMLGVKDVDAELALIEADEATQPQPQSNGVLGGGLSNPLASQDGGEDDG